MTRFVAACVVAGALVAVPALAQQSATESDIRRAAPYSSMKLQFPDLTLQEYNDAIRSLVRERTRQVSPLGSLDSRLSQPTPLYRRPSYQRSIPTPSYPMPMPSYRQPSSGSTYDWQSENLYTWRRGLNGTTHVNGLNSRTGSMWQTDIKPDGSMSGFDKDFNPWRYDARTGTYMNLGTGRMCIGEGFARTCF